MKASRIRTITVHGAEEPGAAMAPFYGVTGLIRGNWIEVEVIGISPDEDTPIAVRKALVGLRVSTIFDSNQINTLFKPEGYRPANMRFAYMVDVIEVLKDAGKSDEAEMLRTISPDTLDIYEFEPGTFIIIEATA